MPPDAECRTHVQRHELGIDSSQHADQSRLWANEDNEYFYFC
jgi:hypothetical protein